MLAALVRSRERDAPLREQPVRYAGTTLASGGVLLLALACGGQSVAHRSDSNKAGTGPSDTTGGSSMAGGGESTPSSGNGGGGATSGSGGSEDDGGSSTSGAGAATGGVSAAGAESSGAAGTSSAPPPDFDLTIEPGAAVTYMIDPAHSGAQPSSIIDPPLELLWSRRFEGGVSYPLVVGGRVFVTANGAGLRIPTVYALDGETGETLWEITPFGTDLLSTSAQLAYDRGRVFAANESGNVAAFDAESGATAWSVVLDDAFAFLSFPVAVGGAVFVVGPASSGDHLYALNEQDGSIVYSKPSRPGEPTIGGGLVFATSGCFETSALEIETGEELWHYEGDCFGGGGGRTGFWSNYLFASDTFSPIGVLDTVTGQLYRTLDPPGIFWPMTFGTAPLAAQADSTGAGVLVTYDATIMEGKVVPLGPWPRLPVLSTANYAYVVFTEENRDPLNIAAIDPNTGAIAWQSSANDQIPADPDWINQGGNPYEGIAASDELIVVGVNRTVAVYAPVEAM